MASQKIVVYVVDVAVFDVGWSVDLKTLTRATVTAPETAGH